jgi:hypothetical protein
MLNNLKNIFSIKNLEEKIKKYYKNDTRENKLKINDVLAYQLLYSSINNTKEYASRSVNYEIQKSISCSAYYEQTKKYSLSFYEDILTDLNLSYDKFTNNDNKKNNINCIIKNRLNNSFIDEDLINSQENCVFLLIDGSCNSSYQNNNLRTDNTIFVYDYIKSSCIDAYTKKKSYSTKKKTKKEAKLTKTGKTRKPYGYCNKNNEVNMFSDYINTHYKKLQKMYKNKTIIFICDRAYHSYKLFNLLESYGFKYIIRIKNNNLLVDNDKNNAKVKSNETLYFKKNTRCITYSIPLTIEYTDIKTNKKKKSDVKSVYNIITNLLDVSKFSNNIIEKLYHIRWHIEIFFKFTKKYTKLGFFKEKNIIKHKIMRICISIINILLKFLIHIYMNSSLFKNNKKYKNYLNDNIIRNINYSLLVEGLYTKFLVKLIKNKYNHNKLINFVDCYFKLFTNKQNRKFPRVSIIPFTKWYIKKYHQKYDMDTIITAITNGTVDQLHKNLKLKVKSFLSVFALDKT